jgi:cell wall-associated NlpC family hydrolase
MTTGRAAGNRQQAAGSGQQAAGSEHEPPGLSASCQLPAASWVGLIGAPFEPGGRGPGYDCWTLACEVLRRMDRPFPAIAYRPEDVLDPAYLHATMAAQIASGRWVGCAADLGAVLAIRNAPIGVNHVGVIVAPGVFLHTLQKIGAHLAQVASPAWRHRIMGSYRWTV